LIAVVVAFVSGNPVYDAIGSMAVGALLVVVAVLLSVEIKAMITGESAEAETEHAIRAFLKARTEVAEVYSLLTLQLGRASCWRSRRGWRKLHAPVHWSTRLIKWRPICAPLSQRCNGCFSSRTTRTRGEGRGVSKSIKSL
jgi:hypothetical protein